MSRNVRKKIAAAKIEITFTELDLLICWQVPLKTSSILEYRHHRLFSIEKKFLNKELLIFWRQNVLHTLFVTFILLFHHFLKKAVHNFIKWTSKLKPLFVKSPWAGQFFEKHISELCIYLLTYSPRFVLLLQPMNLTYWIDF